MSERTNGKSRTPTYKTWWHMVERCYNENDKSYKHYGGRGIKVCREWRFNFSAFYDYVSKLPNFGEEGRTLDRINNNGSYRPGNVRWADSKTQNNNKRNIRKIYYNGKSQTLTEWATELGVDMKLLWNRLYQHNMSVEEAFTLGRYEHREKVAK